MFGCNDLSWSFSLHRHRRHHQTFRWDHLDICHIHPVIFSKFQGPITEHDCSHCSHCSHYFPARSDPRRPSTASRIARHRGSVKSTWCKHFLTENVGNGDRNQLMGKTVGKTNWDNLGKAIFGFINWWYWCPGASTELGDIYQPFMACSNPKQKMSKSW